MCRRLLSPSWSLGDSGDASGLQLSSLFCASASSARASSASAVRLREDTGITSERGAAGLRAGLAALTQWVERECADRQRVMRGTTRSATSPRTPCSPRSRRCRRATPPSTGSGRRNCSACAGSRPRCRSAWSVSGSPASATPRSGTATASGHSGGPRPSTAPDAAGTLRPQRLRSSRCPSTPNRGLRAGGSGDRGWRRGGYGVAVAAGQVREGVLELGRADDLDVGVEAADGGGQGWP